MSERYKEFSYEITDDIDFMDRQNAMTLALKEILNTLYFDIINGKKGMVDKLLSLIEQHPLNPQLKNYLSIAYKMVGNNKKSYEVNRWIVKEHPDYLFGRLNLAGELIEKGELDKVPEIMGNLLDIQEMYPERKIFHIGEVLGYNKLAIHYFLAIDNLDAAKSRLDIMERLAPEHPDTEEIAKNYNSTLLKKGLEFYEKSREGAIEAKANRSLTRKQTSTSPVFINKVVEYIYQRGLEIDPLMLESILQAPRESLIQDLENALIDSIARYKYFEKLEKKGESSEETFSFPIHALFLLAELRSENSLDLVLEFCSQNVDFLEFWLGNHLTESLPEIFYYLGKNQLKKLNNFLQQPNIFTYVRTAVSEAVLQIAFHEPSRRQEVLAWFEDIFTFFLSAPVKNGIIDSDTISLMISDAADARLKELIPLVEKLYEKGYVLEGVAGTIDEVIDNFEQPQDTEYKYSLLNIFDRYQHIITIWDEYNYEDYPPFENIPTTPITNPFKSVGRNDPCPCGSGKKYKNCCGKN